MNHLASETSLYLRQHAQNPVDWYPWGPQALARARDEAKPIFLSIGYSACHWCHVMEHESFLDAEVAAFLNEHFINIKVDREERPDIDNIYMNAVLALTGHGGWPMSVFLTPELHAFYAGTYFPPEQRYGMPSFRQVLKAVSDAWQNKREGVIEQSLNITKALADHAQVDGAGNVELTESMLTTAGKMLSRAYDLRYGGFGRAPKFPHPLDLRLLLRLYHRFNDVDALQMVTHTLDQMARGGIYDQLAGGFHRYSTDERWLAPHFEKMLYDNALLVPVYLEAFQATKHDFFKRIAEETLAWVEREMTSLAGGFYSTTDADSEGVEGKFFVWSLEEMEQILGEEADFASGVFDITDGGNWEGHTILTRPKSDAQESHLHQLAEDAFLQRVEAIKSKLLAVRERRVKPGRDEKILAAWNGLMISAFAQASMVLRDKKYVTLAGRAADFVLTRMRQPDGKLYRTSLAEGPAKLNAYLEDYAFMIEGLLQLAEASWEQRWLDSAIALADIMITQFWDQEQGGFFFVSHDHETLIMREKQANDNATPSGNSMAITVLLRLGRLTGSVKYTEYAEKALRLFTAQMGQQPMSYGQMLIALDDWLGTVEEYAVFPVGKVAEKEQVLRNLYETYKPRKVVVGPPLQLPLLQDRAAVSGQITVYRCVNQSCELPWVGVDQIIEKLKS
ncbi:MAG TPA: thioredoxin domain-containing protein [Gemmatales bacterium]|nr:thioredoxin domain-containing protein [Gemmatales bacterium]